MKKYLFCFICLWFFEKNSPRGWCSLHTQRRIQSLSDAGISAWAPKLGAQIKGELMEKKHQPFNHILNVNA